MKNLLLPFALVFAFAVFSFGQKAPSGNVQRQMTQVELLGHPIGTKTVIESTTWIYRTGPGDQTLEEPHREITVSDFLENGQLYLIRRYDTGNVSPFRMEHHIRIGDREGIVLEPLKDLVVVNEKTVPTVAPYRVPKGTNTAAMGITRYTYDRVGRIVEVKRVNPEGKWIDTKSYKYDDHGRIIEHIERSIFDDEPIVITYKYDLQGQLAEDIYSNSMATFTTTYSDYKLDGRGNWIERATVSWTKSKSAGINGGDLVPKEARRYRTIVYHGN